MSTAELDKLMSARYPLGKRDRLRMRRLIEQERAAHPLNAAALAVCRQYRWDANAIRVLYAGVQFGSRAECFAAAELRRVYHRAWRWAFAGRRSPPPRD